MNSYVWLSKGYDTSLFVSLLLTHLIFFPFSTCRTRFQLSFLFSAHIRISHILIDISVIYNLFFYCRIIAGC